MNPPLKPLKPSMETSLLHPVNIEPAPHVVRVPLKVIFVNCEQDWNTLLPRYVSDSGNVNSVTRVVLKAFVSTLVSFVKPVKSNAVFSKSFGQPLKA